MKKFIILMGVILIGTFMTSGLMAADQTASVNATAYIYTAISTPVVTDMEFVSKSIGTYDANVSSTNGRITFTYDTGGDNAGVTVSLDAATMDLSGPSSQSIRVNLALQADAGSAGSADYSIVGTMDSANSSVVSGGSFTGSFGLSINYN